MQEHAELLRVRILEERAAFQGDMPERYALAWHGYLAAALEWGVIPISQYEPLMHLLPAVTEPDPILSIFLGRDDLPSTP